MVDIGISKRKRIITLVLNPNREKYWDFMFPVMCADIINWLERPGKEGGFETPNWTKEGNLFFSKNL